MYKGLLQMFKGHLTIMNLDLGFLFDCASQLVTYIEAVSAFNVL